MSEAEEPKTKITGMSDADVKNDNIDKAFDLTESGLDSLDKGVGEHGDKFVGMCTSAFGSMGGKFGGALKTGCSSMISGCKSLMPKCREEAHKLSVEAESRDFKVSLEALKQPQSAKPSMSYIKERREELAKPLA
mmetsp:Transcript_29198/g.94141  ORF Transcript_29198/g.94141 Transcript_29198/m.94141 type:complete len:135 (+) Transcript_29198:47-451(+)